MLALPAGAASRLQGVDREQQRERSQHPTATAVAPV
jgi:hypothetical protein